MEGKRKRKRYYIKAEVSYEEREKYRKQARENGLSMSALIINSLEKNINVNIDTTDFRRMIIQINKIGTNINSLLRNIYFKDTFLDRDITPIEIEMNKLNRFAEEEKKRLQGIKREFEDMSIDELRNILISQKERVPLYMEQHGFVEHIRDIIIEFRKMLIEHKFDEAYIPFLTYYLKSFKPERYTREELLAFSDELQTFYNDITALILSVDKKLTEDDFNDLMKILNKHRKESD